MTIARIDRALRDMPVVAILRGIRPEEAPGIGEVLVGAGITVLEIPLNSPSPFKSISLLRERLGDDIVVGAGTVTTTEEVDAVRAAGGELIVSPNTNARVIRQCISCGLLPMPGIASPTEAFTAIGAGATRLKLFPASVFGTGMLRALLDVLPKEVSIVAVGGIDATNTGAWAESGAAGVGAGSAIFTPGDSPADTRAKANALVDAARRARWSA